MGECPVCASQFSATNDGAWPPAAPWVKQSAFSTFEGSLPKGLHPVLTPPVWVRYVVKQKWHPSLALDARSGAAKLLMICHYSSVVSPTLIEQIHLVMRIGRILVGVDLLK
jgi:hypothetical protein